MAEKGHPERVDPTFALQAIREADSIGAAYTHYILAHYRATGDLAPGCDARDLYAWWDEYNGRQLENQEVTEEVYT